MKRECFSADVAKTKRIKVCFTDVHHRQPCVAAQVALKVTALHSCVKDLDGVV